MTGVPDTAHHGGSRTVVRRVLWLAGLLLGLWLLSWILADEAHADGLGIPIPVVDQVVQPVVDTVVPDTGKVADPIKKAVQGLGNGPVKDLVGPVKKTVDALPDTSKVAESVGKAVQGPEKGLVGSVGKVVDALPPSLPDTGKVLEPVGKVVQGLENGPVKDLLEPVKKTVDALPVQLPDVGKVLEPVGKVVQGLEKGPVKDLLDPVKKTVGALPMPLPDVVTPILEPVGSVGDTIGGLTPDPETVLPATPATPAGDAPAKVKPAAHSTVTTAPTESVATAESSAKVTVRHDFRIPVAAEVMTPKTVLLNHFAHHPAGHAPLSGRSDAPAVPGQTPAPATTLGATGSVAAVVAHDAAPDLTAPGRLIRPQGVFAPLWRSLKPGTSPG